MTEKLTVENLTKAGNIEIILCSSTGIGKLAKKLTVCIALEANEVWYGIYANGTLQEEAKTLAEAVELFNNMQG